MEDLFQQLLPFLQGIVSLVLGYVLFHVGRYINRSTEEFRMTDEFKALQRIAKASAEYAQQVYKELDGEQRYDIAKSRALLILEQRGIKISEAELETLIEQAVFQFNQGLEGENEFNNDQPKEVEGLVEAIEEPVSEQLTLDIDGEEEK